MSELHFIKKKLGKILVVNAKKTFKKNFRRARGAPSKLVTIRIVLLFHRSHPHASVEMTANPPPEAENDDPREEGVILDEIGRAHV